MEKRQRQVSNKELKVSTSNEYLEAHPSLLIKLIDMLHSPVDVGAGDDGSEDKKDCGSLLQPVPVRAKGADRLVK